MKIHNTESIKRMLRLSDDVVMRGARGLRRRDHLAEALVFPHLAFAHIFFSEKEI